ALHVADAILLDRRPRRVARGLLALRVRLVDAAEKQKGGQACGVLHGGLLHLTIDLGHMVERTGQITLYTRLRYSALYACWRVNGSMSDGFCARARPRSKMFAATLAAV